MKFKYLTILSIMFCLCLFNQVKADEEYSLNIRQWTFKQLTSGSDQDEHVKVSKYYNYYEQSQYAFCIEPEQDYLPVSCSYELDKYDNENIFNIVKAYDAIGKEDDNYYIAAQILIWKEVNGVDYTFDSNDYDTYKQDLLNYINPKRPLLKSVSSLPESYVGEEGLIKQDYSDYDIETDGVDILSNDENGIKYIIKEDEPEIKTLGLTPKDNDSDSSFVFKSDGSQDLYYHDGDYNNLKPLTLSLRTLYKSTTFDLFYSKKDTNSNPIEGAEFTVYQLNNVETNEEIVFIHNGIQIDIYEAILGDYSKYNDLSIKVSERYDIYLDDKYIQTDEIGYFPYVIFESQTPIKEGRCYVTNDYGVTGGTYSRINTKAIFKGFSEDLDVNTINSLDNSSMYYLCESEPKKGYTYATEPCVLVDGSTYEGKPFGFINSSRTYTLRLMKQSPDNILLDGAKFRITYNDDGIDRNIEFVTGSLVIFRNNPNKYLIYKHESDGNPVVIEPGSNVYQLDNPKQGKYYYYESDSSIVNDSLLNDKYAEAIKGGFSIKDLPYSSSITIEELVAPKGFIITEPIYHLTPNIAYSEITFKNYRVNTLDIIPGKFKIPKTCVNG